MTDEEADKLFESTGIDVRLARPVLEPALSSAGKAAQADLLRCLGAMRATIEMMEVAVRDFPGNDAAFDSFDTALATQIAEANAALARLRQLRDCRGIA